MKKLRHFPIVFLLLCVMLLLTACGETKTPQGGKNEVQSGTRKSNGKEIVLSAFRENTVSFDGENWFAQLDDWMFAADFEAELDTEQLLGIKNGYFGMKNGILYASVGDEGRFVLPARGALTVYQKDEKGEWCPSVYRWEGSEFFSLWLQHVSLPELTEEMLYVKGKEVGLTRECLKSISDAALVSIFGENISAETTEKFGSLLDALGLKLVFYTDDTRITEFAVSVNADAAKLISLKFLDESYRNDKWEAEITFTLSEDGTVTGVTLKSDITRSGQRNKIELSFEPTEKGLSVTGTVERKHRSLDLGIAESKYGCGAVYADRVMTVQSTLLRSEEGDDTNPMIELSVTVKTDNVIAYDHDGNRMSRSSFDVDYFTPRRQFVLRVDRTDRNNASLTLSLTEEEETRILLTGILRLGELKKFPALPSSIPAG